MYIGFDTQRGVNPENVSAFGFRGVTNVAEKYPTDPPLLEIVVGARICSQGSFWSLNDCR